MEVVIFFLLKGNDVVPLQMYSHTPALTLPLFSLWREAERDWLRCASGGSEVEIAGKYPEGPQVPSSASSAPHVGSVQAGGQRALQHVPYVTWTRRS